MLTGDGTVASRFEDIEVLRLAASLDQGSEAPVDAAIDASLQGLKLRYQNQTVQTQVKSMHRLISTAEH
jgi:hypothetical protein